MNRLPLTALWAKLPKAKSIEIVLLLLFRVSLATETPESFRENISHYYQRWRDVGQADERWWRDTIGGYFKKALQESPDWNMEDTLDSYLPRDNEFSGALRQEFYRARKEFIRVEVYLTVLGDAPGSIRASCKMPSGDPVVKQGIAQSDNARMVWTYFNVPLQRKSEQTYNIVFHYSTLTDTLEVELRGGDSYSDTLQYFHLLTYGKGVRHEDCFYVPYIDASRTLARWRHRPAFLPEDWRRDMNFKDDTNYVSSMMFAFGNGVRQFRDDREEWKQLFAKDCAFGKYTRLDSLFAHLGRKELVREARRHGRKVVVFPIFTDGIHDTTCEPGEKACSFNFRPGGTGWKGLRTILCRSLHAIWMQGLACLVVPILISDDNTSVATGFCRDWAEYCWDPLMTHCYEPLRRACLDPGKIHLHPMQATDNDLILKRLKEVRDRFPYLGFAFSINNLEMASADILIHCSRLPLGTHAVCLGPKPLTTETYLGPNSGLIVIKNFADVARQLSVASVGSILTTIEVAGVRIVVSQNGGWGNQVIQKGNDLAIYSTQRPKQGQTRETPIALALLSEGSAPEFIPCSRQGNRWIAPSVLQQFVSLDITKFIWIVAEEKGRQFSLRVASDSILWRSGLAVLVLAFSVFSLILCLISLLILLFAGRRLSGLRKTLESWNASLLTGEFGLLLFLALLPWFRQWTWRILLPLVLLLLILLYQHTRTHGSGGRKTQIALLAFLPILVIFEVSVILGHRWIVTLFEWLREYLASFILALIIFVQVAVTSQNRSGSTATSTPSNTEITET